MTRAVPTLLLAALMTACGTTDAHAARGAGDLDPWGNRYPPQCRDLSGIDVDHIIGVGRLPVVHNGGDRCGHWKWFGQRSVIYVLETCTVKGREISRAEVLRHEFCHEQMFRLTGDPRWHP